MAVSAAEYIEVRWRVKGTNEAWSSPRRAAPVDEIVVEELDRNTQYEFEVRAVSNCGAPSIWVPSDYTVPGAVPPTSVDTLTAQSLADGVHLGWTSIATPAAGIESSIERSANGTSGWAERARVRSTAYTDPETSGATYYYRVRYVNFAGQFGAYSPVASSNGVNVGSIGTNASNALADAMAAQSAAAAANAALADIASDNLLSPVEKPVVIRDYNVITTEQAGIDAQATAYSITTEKTAYDTAVSALTTYLATLTAPVLWNNLTGNTTIVGATFRQKFADVYTTRQALLNAIYAAAKAKADAAQTTANTAVGQVTQMPVINGGFDIAPTGYGWNADPGTGWTIDTAGNTPGVGPNSAKHVGGTGNGAFRNAGLAACGPGQVYKAQGLIKAVGANGACWVYISWCDAGGNEIGTTPGNQITGTTTAGSYAVGTAPASTVYARTCLGVASHTAGTYYVDNVLCSQYPSSIDDVPDGSMYFRQTSTGRGVNIMPADWSLFLGVASPTSAFAPNLTLSQDATPANLLGVASCLKVLTSAVAPTVMYLGRTGQFITVKPNSRWIVQLGCRCNISGMKASIQMVNAADTILASTSLMTFPNSPAGVVSGVLDASTNADTSARLRIVFSGTYAAGTQLYISFIGLEEQNGGSTTPSAFSPPIARTLDEQTDGTLFGRTSQSDLVNNRVGLGVIGSGMRLGDMRNQVMVGVGNYGAGWSGGSITYSATTTSATISAAAATLQVDTTPLAYNASSVTVTGSAGLVRTYYLYYDDDNYTGGSKTLNATTSQITALSARGRLLVGQVTVTFPTSGTGSGSGGSGCPVREAWVIRRGKDHEPWYVRDGEFIRAGDVRDGDYLLLASGRWGLVTYSEPKLAPCVRVTVNNHEPFSLSCSRTAPLGLCSGGSVLAPDSLSEVVRVLHPAPALCATVTAVDDIGMRWVQHITCEDDFFWAGDHPDCLFSHHNLKPP